jgi:CubicO group peptidase (beta-lactamase class C family)
LLSAILPCADRTNALNFAGLHLLPYLDIHLAKWRDTRGVNMVGTGLHMRTIDMAMLGYLYLSDGKLGRVQVVLQAWVENSTRSQAEGHPEWFGSYSFHWWVSP